MTVGVVPDPASDGVLLDVLQGFVHELRAAGLPVSMTENLDAMRAIEHIDIADREVFRAALASTLVKHARHRRAFDTVFDVYFSLYRHGIEGDDPLGLLADPDAGIPETGAPGGGGTPVSRDELVEMLARALMSMDRETLRRLAAL